LATGDVQVMEVSGCQDDGNPPEREQPVAHGIIERTRRVEDERTIVQPDDRHARLQARATERDRIWHQPDRLRNVFLNVHGDTRVLLAYHRRRALARGLPLGHAGAVIAVQHFGSFRHS
jgi:hypothetical protein